MDYSVVSPGTNSSGSFSFDSGFSAFDGRAGGATGVGFASFMLGYPAIEPIVALGSVIDASQYWSRQL
jgi:hypothetical protein